ncbi:MAG: phosphoribosylamine--glycine ligase [Bdellovibrionales bacterium]
MRFLVLGQGAREHALVRALKHSPSVTEIHASPGSDGISQDALCHDLDWTDAKAVESFVRRYAFDCVIVGPEKFLVQGVSDLLRELGLTVVGPSQVASRLEGSKVFAKKFMEEAGVPTADYEVVDSVASTLKAATRFAPPYVLKADGLAEGKGVFICPSLGELKSSAEKLFEEKALGSAGTTAVLEECLKGYELSYLVLTNGDEYQSLPLAQDHKRLKDGGEGPNTGGMGAVGPLQIGHQLQEQIEAQIVQPVIRHLKGSGLLYRGVLYIGIMVTPDGPSVLEFNVRFGDPEAQVILPQLDGDWGHVMAKLGRGELVPLKWNGMHVACVVMASPGYPDAPVKGVRIEGDLGSHTSSSYFLTAGVRRDANSGWVTNGGRVLNAVGLGSTMKEAIQAAYGQAKKVSWEGVQVRKDIGAAQI